jgi:hypothetical protein
MYKELRSELVYRVELLQRAGLGAGTKWVKTLLCVCVLGEGGERYAKIGVKMVGVNKVRAYCDLHEVEV